jgi:hypothetical protein
VTNAPRLAAFVVFKLKCKPIARRVDVLKAQEAHKTAKTGRKLSFDGGKRKRQALLPKGKTVMAWI